MEGKRGLFEGIIVDAHKEGMAAGRSRKLVTVCLYTGNREHMLEVCTSAGCVYVCVCSYKFSKHPQ